jgi:quinol monooxygenase YgiN
LPETFLSIQKLEKHMLITKNNPFRSGRFPHLAFFAALALAAVVPTMAQAECSSDEVGFIAIFDIQPGSEADFEAAILQLTEVVNRVEPGVILYAPYKGEEGKYYMMERYTDLAARDSHGSSPEVQALFPSLAPTFNGAPQVLKVTAVCP